MVELLQLLEAGLAFTAVTVTLASAPVAIMSGEPLPDISPMVESLVNKDVEQNNPMATEPKPASEYDPSKDDRITRPTSDSVIKGAYDPKADDRVTRPTK